MKVKDRETEERKDKRERALKQPTANRSLHKNKKQTMSGTISIIVTKKQKQNLQKKVTSDQLTVL